MTMKKIIVVQLVLFTMVACEKKALNTTIDTLKKPVVEAYLSPGKTPQVKITYQLAFGSGDTTVQSIKDLQVTLETGGVEYPLEYMENDTAYLGNWLVKEQQDYTLRFSYGDGVVTAHSQVPMKPDGFKASAGSLAIPQFSGTPGSGGFPTFPDPVNLTWENTDGAYYLVVVENLESDPESIFETSGDQPPRPTFRSEPEQANAYEIGFQRFEYYGTHRIILFRLNAEYASLYSDNGNSSQNLTTPFSNIEGGLGIFTGINADTLLLEVTK
jgi:Domain of unknown function (DUF4249)